MTWLKHDLYFCFLITLLLSKFTDYDLNFLFNLERPPFYFAVKKHFLSRLTDDRDIYSIYWQMEEEWEKRGWRIETAWSGDGWANHQTLLSLLSCSRWVCGRRSTCFFFLLLPSFASFATFSPPSRMVPSERKSVRGTQLMYILHD